MSDNELDELNSEEVHIDPTTHELLTVESDDVDEDVLEEEEHLAGQKATAVTEAESKRILEALLFASEEVLTAAKLKTIMPGEPDARAIRKMVVEINSQMSKERHPFEIIELGGGFQFRTIAYFSPWVRQLLKEKAAKRLSQQSLESLAIIAYKQPISKAEIEAIRGVVADGAIKTLLERKLVTITGRSEKPGRPLLYGTTKEFLIYFGLKNVTDLPNIEEFEALVKEKMGDLEQELAQFNPAPQPVEEIIVTKESDASALESEEQVPSPEHEIAPIDAISQDAGIEEIDASVDVEFLNKQDSDSPEHS